jgi:hypothetical protein
MKIRQGFVSNSSSSSFIVKKCTLTPAQEVIMRNHRLISEEVGDAYNYPEDGFWEISEHDDHYVCHTIMDNFDLREFLIDLGIRCGKEESW